MTIHHSGKMAMSLKSNHLIILSAILTVLISIATANSHSDLVSELLSLQSQSTSGVIHLNDHLISRFLTSTKTPRPYSILIFFDAHQLHSKPELHLQDLHNEFSLLASSFVTNNPSDHGKLFFCDIEFKESQSSFGMFGVNSLPHIRLVGPDAKSLKDDSIQMDQGDFSRMAESMADFVQSRTKLSVGPIHRPPLLSKKQIGLIVLIILIWLPFAIKKIIAGETLLHDRKIWLLGSVFVYFFSVSGAMHNIIRKVPMFLVDRNDPNKLVFFYQGSGMQLGAEGFAIGSLYTIVGLLLALVTNVLVKVKNVTAQRVVMIFALLVSFWAVRKVIYLDNWKTGYGVHGYWPSIW
ncbi:probable dolichyl-diphosphooligosaccharide--protein glycosyltransferase subunit 3B [Mangifera indica]|uniref:probable dolichyl-diphosphooligosaccharide--protein glycosyltransferase subunit 3B n=1 Tax=Mangifera indica TaxID=29780 RepID=UPI001CFB0402|nr:probable dolichyl-diphosphooligosaccharide--protein glycosyltransferase subunit 3B [Mangifera indica]